MQTTRPQAAAAAGRPGERAIDARSDGFQAADLGSRRATAAGVEGE
jgi:hypothetical protein